MPLLSQTTFRSAMLAAFVAGCSEPSTTTANGPDNLGRMATNLFSAAAMTNKLFFSSIMRPNNRGQEDRVIAMILQSGIVTNFSNHLETNGPSTIRLNYHDPGRGLHFQVDLTNAPPGWAIKDIWTCR